MCDRCLRDAAVKSVLVLAWLLLAGVPAWSQAPPDETTSGDVASARTCVVQRGDTLAAIARRCDVTVEQLKLANSRTDDFVREGDVLVVSRAMPEI
ncbi:MAG TPA: LysM domain-containing protein, partial [Planctomycetota bacterium]|nr:LysM domain-containing protein [Planctomycetota bacterium]